KLWHFEHSSAGVSACVSVLGSVGAAAPLAGHPLASTIARPVLTRAALRRSSAMCAIVSAMLPVRDARLVRLLLRATVVARPLLLAVALAAACTPSDSRPAPPAQQGRSEPEAPPPSPPPGRTANDDV